MRCQRQPAVCMGCDQGTARTRCDTARWTDRSRASGHRTRPRIPAVERSGCGGFIRRRLATHRPRGSSSASHRATSPMSCRISRCLPRSVWWRMVASTMPSRVPDRAIRSHRSLAQPMRLRREDNRPNRGSGSDLEVGHPPSGFGAQGPLRRLTPTPVAVARRAVCPPREVPQYAIRLRGAPPRVRST